MMKKINYIFFGSPEFAETVLARLIEAGLPPLAVVANPDRPFGRKKIITPPPVKILAEANSIPVFQPEKITDEFIGKVKELSPDLFVVAAYAKIIPKKLIDVPSLGALGVHPSLLPKFRGASPIQSVILSGEKETGVAIYLMDELVDHGPVFAESRFEIKPAETYSELLGRLAETGGELISKVLPQIVSHEITPVAQNEAAATFTKKFKTEDAFLAEEVLALATSGEHEREAELADRMIRALNPDPGVWTMKGGKRIKLLEAELVSGKLELKTVQVEGKSPVKFRDGII